MPSETIRQLIRDWLNTRKQVGTMSNTEHSLMSEALDHAERARYFAAAAVKDLQCGRHWSAESAMALAATERHLHYEKWDTAEVAYAAKQECWNAKRDAK